MNLVLICLDQLRPDRLVRQEPWEALRRETAFFPGMITHAPYTIASLHAVVTGRYGRDTGVDGYTRSPAYRADRVRSLALRLRDRGYRTYGDLINPLVMPRQGFDRFQVHDENRDDLIERHCRLLTDWSRRDPSFIYLHYSTIHTRMVRDVIGKYGDFDADYFGRIPENRARYDGYVREAGDYLTAVWDHMRRSGILDRTVVALFTDHGCSLGERPGEKCYGVYLYDYTLRVFAHLWTPDRRWAGLGIDAQVRTVDLAPTLLDLLGASEPESGPPPAGESLRPLLDSGGGPDRPAFSETGGLGGPSPSPDGPNLHAWREPPWKMIVQSDTGAREIYNVTTDPDERENLAGRHPAPEDDFLRKMQACTARRLPEVRP